MADTRLAHGTGRELALRRMPRAGPVPMLTRMTRALPTIATRAGKPAEVDAAMPGTLQQLRYVILLCDDLAGTRAFYHEVLGLPVHRDGDG